MSPNECQNVFKCPCQDYFIKNKRLGHHLKLNINPCSNIDHYNNNNMNMPRPFPQRGVVLPPLTLYKPMCNTTLAQLQCTT